MINTYNPNIHGVMALRYFFFLLIFLLTFEVGIIVVSGLSGLALSEVEGRYPDKTVSVINAPLPTELDQEGLEVTYNGTVKRAEHRFALFSIANHGSRRAYLFSDARTGKLDVRLDDIKFHAIKRLDRLTTHVSAEVQTGSIGPDQDVMLIVPLSRSDQPFSMSFGYAYEDAVGRIMTFEVGHQRIINAGWGWGTGSN